MQLANYKHLALEADNDVNIFSRKFDAKLLNFLV